MDKNLTYENNTLRKVVNGATLAIEQGDTLGVSFLDHKTKELKTFQLAKSEITLLISYLSEIEKEC